MNRWYEPFNCGIVAIDWSVFLEKYLPLILKLAGLSHTQVTRHAASQIIVAATNFAVSRNCLNKNLLTAYLELCQDIDTLIRIATLKNLQQRLLRLLDAAMAKEHFVPELLACAKDPNTGIRLIVIQIVVENHPLFETEQLRIEFAPVLVREIKQGWVVSDNWILQNFSQVLTFLSDRELMDGTYAEPIYKFYDVSPKYDVAKIDGIALDRGRTEEEGVPAHFCGG